LQVKWKNGTSVLAPDHMIDLDEFASEDFGDVGALLNDR
jgi:hypothetical protein